MSFKMNGTEYTIDRSQFRAGSGATGILRIAGALEIGTCDPVLTAFPFWFEIRTASKVAICAILMPKEFPISMHMPY